MHESEVKEQAQKAKAKPQEVVFGLIRESISCLLRAVFRKNSETKRLFPQSRRHELKIAQTDEPNFVPIYYTAFRRKLQEFSWIFFHFLLQPLRFMLF